RRIGRAVAWIVLLVLAAVGVNVVGIGLVGDVEGWMQWLDARAGYFVVWRLCLYSATIYGWLWMRRRLCARHPSVEARQRLRYAEIGALAAVALLEASMLWRQP